MRKLAILSLLLLYPAGRTLAEPCLLIYPLQKTVFRYDPSKYLTITSNDPRFDPAYARAGEVLWDIIDDRIASEVYQAPLLQGFEKSSSGRNEFFIPKTEATILVDGFYHTPRLLNDIVVRFIPFPTDVFIEILVNGSLIDNFRHYIPVLSVSTVLEGLFYSDTVAFDVRWTGAEQIRLNAFADKNGNKVYDGEPCFCVVLEDPTVPVESTTWGQIKSLYK